MPISKIIISLFIIPVLLLSPLSAPAEANTIYQENEIDRVELLTELQRLLSILLKLQAELALKNPAYQLASASLENQTPYQAKFFTTPSEAIYFVEGGQLREYRDKSVRVIDQELFDLFLAVVGEAAIEKSVREWRVFHDKNIDLGAYVESMYGLEHWLVSVNREGFAVNDQDTTESFAKLFVHEYAHILLTDFPELSTNFSQRFWTSADYANQAKVKLANRASRFDLTSSYYDNNLSRFVSDYATTDPNEDLAETFLYFIQEDRPTGNTIHDQKIQFFYQEPELIKIRIEVRGNLKELGVL